MPMRFILKYSYAKMKDLLTALDNVCQSKMSSLIHSMTGCRLFATESQGTDQASTYFVSGILFISSGYKANLEIYNLITNQIIAVDGLREFWQYLIAPIGVLALLAQLGITVLFGLVFLHK